MPLEEMSKMYELYVYTAGDRRYAETVATLLDRELLSSRDERARPTFCPVASVLASLDSVVSQRGGCIFRS